MFNEIFQYELNNRAFAFISVNDLAQKMVKTEQAAFWLAYASLEKLNRPRYEYMGSKYGLEPNLLIVKLKAWSTGIGFSLFPKKMLSIMTTATIKYVDKLKLLPDMGKEEDRDFFEYVVAQEQVQAEALAYALEQRFDLAAGVLNEFVRKANKSYGGKAADEGTGVK